MVEKTGQRLLGQLILGEIYLESNLLQTLQQHQHQQQKQPSDNAIN